MSEDKKVFEGNCNVTITHPDRSVQKLGDSPEGTYDRRSVSIIGGKTVIERPGTGVTTIVPEGAEVKIEGVNER
ncbi:MAG: hypothetical protein ABIH51_01985 [Patescibacteria group bacterium]